jgi:Asp-tRNA(Asn)/Glu-tRNA(Gln) amidotransferase B subunit
VNRFRELGATFSDALTLLEPAQYGALFERLVARGIEGQTAASVVINDFRAGGLAPAVVLSNEDGVVAIVEAKSSLPRDVYREAVRRSAEADFAVEPFLAQVAVSDTSQLEPLVDRILEANPGQVAAYRGGKEGLLGFFVGQVMRETEGKANPKVVSELVREKLGA